MNRVITGYQVGTRLGGKQTTFTKLDFLKTRFVIKLLFLGAFVVSLSLFYIWSRIQIVQLGYEINEYKHEQMLLLDESKKLKIEASLLKSPTRLQDLLNDKIHMALPEKDKIIAVQP